MTELSAAQLRLSSAFKYVYYASFAFIFPVSLLLGVLGMFGMAEVKANGEQVFGFAAFFTAIALGFVIPLFFSIWVTIGTAILRLVGKHAPILRARG